MACVTDDGKFHLLFIAIVCEETFEVVWELVVRWVVSQAILDEDRFQLHVVCSVQQRRAVEVALVPDW